jgi:hypothetical protein
MVLTPEQIAEFKALGYILVPNLVDPSTLDNWRAQIRAKFGDLSDPAQQNAAGSRQQHPLWTFRPPASQRPGDIPRRNSR